MVTGLSATISGGRGAGATYVVVVEVVVVVVAGGAQAVRTSATDKDIQQESFIATSHDWRTLRHSMTVFNASDMNCSQFPG